MPETLPILVFPMHTLLLNLFLLTTLTAPDFRITAVNEIDRTMDKTIFASADSAVVDKYIPNGAPASMSSFVLFSGNDTVLVDTGLGGESWVKKIADLGVEAKNVKLILLTHLHPDHIGGLFDGNAKRFPNAVVRCSQKEYDGMAAPRNKIKAVYGEAFEKTFAFDDTVFDNGIIKIKALDAVGHTPGHTAFLITSANSKFLIVGDLLHAAALQFPKPEICSSYDSDPLRTVASRKRILNLAAEENLPIGGMHFPSPSTGKVKADGNGGFVFSLDKNN